ncbi:MAG TPA: Do family serine endopeptidase [Sediminispirochaeta sp.]|nr:Do family serine endopeptidase [Sediminispirochaeta sp.]
MKDGKLFYSKKFFVFNLVLVGVIVGFTLAFMIFGNSFNISFGEPVEAMENSRTEEPEPVPPVPEGQAMQKSFREVAQKVLPVVVELKVVEVVRQQVPSAPRGWPWDFLYPDRDKGEEPKGQEREFRNQGLGSGVIVRKDGNKHYVLTNNHVVGEADEIQVVLNDGREFTASMIGSDPRRDLAMVMFESRDRNIPIAELGDSDDLYVGDWVLAVGSPFGFVSSVTAGIVSAKGRSGPQGNISDFIQTDAAINRGNSGGALVDTEGKVIGINTWIAAPTGGNIGLGFAIPINNAKRAIDDFITKGSVEYGWLGVSVGDVNSQLADELELDDGKGALVHNVYLDSPADKAGLKPGDFITHIDGRPVESRDEVVRIVGNLVAGDLVDFRVQRMGRSIELEVEIGVRADEKEILSNQKKLWPGMAVVPLEEQAREELGIPDSEDGVLVISVERGTKAYIHGIRPYDLITTINGDPVEEMQDFYRLIGDSSRDKFEISYIREGEKGYAGIVR